MSHAKCVELTFASLGESAQSLVFSVVDEVFSSSCQNFMTIGLMTYVPNQLVVGGLVNVMQRYGQFNNPQTGSKMPAMDTYNINNELAQLLTNLEELLPG